MDEPSMGDGVFARRHNLGGFAFIAYDPSLFALHITFVSYDCFL